MMSDSAMMKIIGASFADFLKKQVPSSKEELVIKRAMFIAEFIELFITLTGTIGMSEAKHICENFPLLPEEPLQVTIDSKGNISISDVPDTK
jgi:hypothetical protein